MAGLFAVDHTYHLLARYNKDDQELVEPEDLENPDILTPAENPESDVRATC